MRSIMGCIEFKDVDRSSNIDYECIKWQTTYDFSDLDLSDLRLNLSDNFPLPVIVNNSIPLQVEEINPVENTNELQFSSGFTMPEITIPEIQVPEITIPKTDVNISLFPFFIGYSLSVIFTLFALHLYSKYKNKEIKKVAIPELTREEKLQILANIKDSDNISTTNS